MTRTLHNIQRLAILIAMIVCVTACQKSDLQIQDEINTDKTANISLNIDSRGFSEVITRANADESQIHSIAVMVFNADGAIRTGEFIDHATSSNVQLRTNAGKDMQIVVVANYLAHNGLKEQLQKITDYNALNSIVVATPTGALDPEKGLVMFGETITDINPASSATPIRVTLNFLFAKVNMVVKVSSNFPTAEKIFINTILTGSLPQDGYLTGRTDAPATQIYTPQTPVSTTGNQTDGLHFTIYTFQNHQGGRTAIAPPSGVTETAQNGHLFKRHYAPKEASYAVIQAEYQKGTATHMLDMYVYFGHNNHDDYNIGRSENHTYTVTINGMDNMNVDTNIEAVTYDFELGFGDNMDMDSHYDFRPLMFNSTNGTTNLALEVLDAHGRSHKEVGFNAHWVKLSPLDLLKFQVRQQGQGNNTHWQAPGSEGEFVRGLYIPHKSWRDKLSSGGWNAIPTGTDNDNSLAYADATYRMCYEITDINLTAPNRVNLNIYADENTSGRKRTAQIAITSTDFKGEVKRRLVPITQESMISLGIINGSEYFVESHEELKFNIYPSAELQLTAKGKTQWGYYTNRIYNSTHLDNPAMGQFLTMNSVFGIEDYTWEQNNSSYIQKQEDGTPIWNPNLKYRTLHLSGIDGFDIVKSMYDVNSTQAPYFYPDYDDWTPIFSGIYNTSAARYCYEKNRDLNGDGFISVEETVWHLPSLSELQHIWMVMPSIDPAHKPTTTTGWADSYYSSTEESRSLAYSMNFSDDITHTSSTHDKSTPLNVRCVRKGNTSSFDEVSLRNNTIVIDNSTIPSSSLTSTEKPLVSASQASDKLLPALFAVAKNNIETPSTWATQAGLSSQYDWTLSGDRGFLAQTGCAIYSEENSGTDKGKWRMPTARELFRIWELNGSGKLAEIKDFTPLDVAKPYWSATELNANAVWAISFDKRSSIRMLMSKNEKQNTRCVRDL